MTGCGGGSCLSLHDILRLVACCLMMFIRPLGFCIIGIFTVEFREYFQWTTMEQSTWFTACHMGPAVIISAVVIGFMLDRIGARITLTVSVLLSSVGLMLSAYVNTLATLYIGYGCLASLGFTAYNIVGSAILQHSFGDRKNMATGLAFTCMSIGSFLWPPMVRMAIDKYCWQGALLLLAAANLHTLPFVPILPLCTKKKDPNRNKDTKIFTHEEKNGLIGEKPKVPTDSHKCIESFKSNCMSKSGDMNTLKGERSKCTTLRKTKYSLFFLFSLSQLFNAFPNYALYLYIPIRCVLQGFTKMEAVALISIMNITSTILRLPAGIVGDIKRINVFWVVTTATAACGLALVLSPFCDTFILLAVFSGVFGVGAAFFVTLVQAVVQKIGGPEELNIGLSMMFAAEGLCGFTFPLSGWFMDYVGSIDLVFVVLGISGLLGSIMVLISGLLHRQFILKVAKQETMTVYA